MGENEYHGESGHFSTVFLLKSHGRDVRLRPCSGLTRLVRAGYSRHDSGASRERARITQRAQDGSVHMQLVSRPAPIPPNRL